MLFLPKRAGSCMDETSLGFGSTDKISQRECSPTAEPKLPKIMAWGAIRWNFKSQIIILGKSVNSETYIEDTGRPET